MVFNQIFYGRLLIFSVFLREVKRADATFALAKFACPVTVHTPVGDQYIVFSDCTV